MKLKQCTKCKEHKPISEFFAFKYSKDRLGCWCRDCTRVSRARYQKTARGRKVFREGNKKYRASGHRASWYKQHPNANNAHAFVHRALRDGRLIKPKKCEQCGDLCKTLHAHHENYNKPLEVKWVCPSCHGRKYRIAM